MYIQCTSPADGHCAKFGWPPVSDVAAVTKARRTRNPLKFVGMPQYKLVNRSQPLVERCSPYCGMCARLFNSFFRLLIHALVAKIQPHTVVPRSPAHGKFLVIFCVLHFSELRAAYFISDLHPKFALRPHHV